MSNWLHQRISVLLHLSKCALYKWMTRAVFSLERTLESSRFFPPSFFPFRPESRPSSHDYDFECWQTGTILAGVDCRALAHYLEGVDMIAMNDDEISVFSFSFYFSSSFQSRKKTFWFLPSPFQNQPFRDSVKALGLTKVFFSCWRSSRWRCCCCCESCVFRFFTLSVMWRTFASRRAPLSLCLSLVSDCLPKRSHRSI